MFRYLKEAFWLRVPLPLIGALPFNVLALAGVGILGFAEHAIWLLGAGAEAAYLFFLVTNPRFQKLVNAQDFQRVQAAAEKSRDDLLAQLPPDSRARLTRLEEKVARISTLYRSNGADDNLLTDSSLDALGKLAALYSRLLVAERHLQTARHETDEAGLVRKTAALERELAAAAPALSPSLRESKQATLALLQKRLANARSRESSLAEVASDLARIEAQVDLALEEAGLQGSRPAMTTGNLNLLNQILESNTALGGELDDFAVLSPDLPSARRPAPIAPPLTQ